MKNKVSGVLLLMDHLGREEEGFPDGKEEERKLQARQRVSLLRVLTGCLRELRPLGLVFALLVQPGKCAQHCRGTAMVEPAVRGSPAVVGIRSRVQSVLVVEES